MPAGGGITLLHVRGIRIWVDFSWFVVLFLIILWLSGSFRDTLGTGSDDVAPYVLAVASALLFFASILLHELGHALVALRNGIGISAITLWMFGGVARMDRDSDSPGTEFKIAIAGPLVTAAIVAACVATGVLLTGADDFRDAAVADAGPGVDKTAAVIGWLAGINLLVLVFNLVPAFPLDGGRVARAIAWKVTGNRTGATRFAATLGQGFAYLLIGFGIFLFFQGDVVGGLWSVVLGFILNGAARGAVAQTAITGRIEGVSVARRDGPRAGGGSRGRIGRARPRRVLPALPLALVPGRRCPGALRRPARPGRRRTAFPRSSARPRRSARSLPATAEWPPSARTTPLESVLGNEALRRLGALVATDDDGRLRGVITVDAIGRALRDPVAGTPG